MKDVQCYELFGGIALKNHAFSFSLLQWTKDNSFMLQNWVELPKRDMPVGAGQAGVSKQQSEKMI